VLDIPAETVKQRLGYVYDSIIETRKDLKGRVPLIGFAGAPWTLMCYMVDGSGSEKTKGKFATAISWLYTNREAAHKLLHRLATDIAAHMVEQVRHGCHLLQLFDSWAGLISPSLYREFGLPYLKLIAETVKREVPEAPIICFAKGAFFALQELSQLPFDALSLDWTIDPQWARQQVEGRVALQGNMDPLALHSSQEVIKPLVRDMLKSFGNNGIGYIANLGHGCLPSFDPASVGAFIDAVHEYSAEVLQK
jgi:uroporphyrinogen decarboxylase